MRLRDCLPEGASPESAILVLSLTLNEPFEVRKLDVFYSLRCVILRSVATILTVLVVRVKVRLLLENGLNCVPGKTKQQCRHHLHSICQRSLRSAPGRSSQALVGPTNRPAVTAWSFSSATGCDLITPQAQLLQGGRMLGCM